MAEKNIGKITLPESLFANKGKLSKEEWEKLQNHPNVGVNLLMNICNGTHKMHPTTNMIHADHQLPAASADAVNVHAPIAIRFGQKPNSPEVIASLSAPMRYATRLARFTPINANTIILQLYQLPKSQPFISRPAMKNDMKIKNPAITFSMKTTCPIPLKKDLIGFGNDLI